MTGVNGSIIHSAYSKTHPFRSVESKKDDIPNIEMNVSSGGATCTRVLLPFASAGVATRSPCGAFAVVLAPGAGMVPQNFRDIPNFTSMANEA